MPSNCIFCKIVAKSSPAEIVYEDDEILVFTDIKPASKHHFLAIPKRHIKNAACLTANDKTMREQLTCYIIHMLNNWFLTHRRTKTQLNFSFFNFNLPMSNHLQFVISYSSSAQLTVLLLFDQVVEKLKTVSLQILEELCGDKDDVLMGFHWPPCNSVPHLHLHIISPMSQMGFISRLTFKPNSFWFVTHDYVLRRVENKL